MPVAKPKRHVSITYCVLFTLWVIGTAIGGYFGYEGAVYAKLHPASSFGPQVTINLKRGPFTVYNYMPKEKPRGIILFGSGDGGWLGWEDTVGKGLCHAGYQVIGINSALYALKDYDLATLQADYNTIAKTFLVSYFLHPPPVLVGGWSMGAAQAVAVAGGPHPPLGLAGVVVASLVPRGRYGLRLSDKMDIPPIGEGTFSVCDFAAHLRNVRVVQLHGTEDIIDSREWLGLLKVQHDEVDVPNAGHPFNGADKSFIQYLAQGVDWAVGQTGSLHASNP